MARKKKKGLKLGLLVFLLLLVGAVYVFSNYYYKIYSASTNVSKGDNYLYIENDWSRSDLVKHLFDRGILVDTSSFIWVADQKQFNTPKPGRYQLKDGMSNNTLVNLLRSGKQKPINLTFNSIRTLHDLASRVGLQIEADSTELMNYFNAEEVQSKYGFSPSTFLGMFIPNTYEMYWSTDAEGFVARMATEYKRFWTAERIAKAKKLGLTQSEVAILASIVQAEQMQHADERARVAGLYVNRLRMGMRLQSDPTLIFAWNDYTIKRVLNKHKELKSAYNTYINAGLPPGLINLPDRSSLDAVLNFEEHRYVYMCAKADFSGYHNFARSLSQHNVYARQYQRELNRRRIMK